jgi:hypothetical protein
MVGVTPFLLWVVPNGDVLKLEAQDAMDSNGLSVEAVQLV